MTGWAFKINLRQSSMNRIVTSTMPHAVQPEAMTWSNFTVTSMSSTAINDGRVVSPAHACNAGRLAENNRHDRHMTAVSKLLLQYRGENFPGKGHHRNAAVLHT
eukprot:4216379-Amphidinium_carterae.1